MLGIAHERATEDPALVNKKLARERFEAAIALAQSGVQLPTRWVRLTRQLEKGKNQTFLAALVTALLARATDPAADPTALQLSAPPLPPLEPYSARGLAEKVVVPVSRLHRIDIGVPGDWPLNNSPFFREKRITRQLSVHPSERPQLELLVDALEESCGMSPDEAVGALAAFVSVRKRTDTLEPGRTVRLRANRMLDLTLGNAAGAILTVNGRRIATGGRGAVVDLSFSWRHGGLLQTRE